MSSPQHSPQKAAVAPAPMGQAGPPAAAPPQSETAQQQQPPQPEQAPAPAPGQPQPPTSASTSTQQAVNFKDAAAAAPTNAAGRRVTIGHGGSTHQGGFAAPQPVPVGADGTRRGSMASTNFNMDDFFGRRMSMGGFDMNMDDLFARRSSMDSTAAALDAAMLDLNRRRFSMAMGGGGGGGAVPPGDMSLGSPAGPQDSRRLSMGLSAGLPAAPFGNPMHGGAPPPQQSAVNNITARQQQLQEQQRELERRQKELEMQRRQLIANMQERNVMGQPQQQPQQQPMMAPPASNPGAYPGSDSLGLGSIHSHGSHISAPTSMPHRPSTQSGGSQQWWICQICNSKAFASQQEAMTHEQICQSNAAAAMQGSAASRNFSLGMDSLHSAHTQHSGGSYENPNMSTGPFALMDRPMPLSMESDKDWLTPLHCFVRAHCVEVFTASESDVATPSKGKRKPIHVGQVGIRCPHCHRDDTNKARERGSVYYPTTISSIYNATMNLLQRHLHNCHSVPDDVMRRYETLKADDARSGTSKRYWVESALSLGLVDTASGIKFSALTPPPLPGLSSGQDSTAHDAGRRRSGGKQAGTKTGETTEAGGATEEPSTTGGADSVPQEAKPLVFPEDKPYATGFSHHLLSQMQACVFTEADRLGKRKGLPPGFPGLACRHCFGGYGSGRFFPSSIKTLSDTSKTLNVLHNHMMRCRKCPEEVREELQKLRTTHDEERAKMKFGSQKAFFARIWERLHGKNAPGAIKRKPPPPPQPTSPAAQYRAMGMPPDMGYPPQTMQQMQMHHMQQQHMQMQPPPQMAPPPQTMMHHGAAGLEALARHAPTPPDAKRQKTQASV